MISRVRDGRSDGSSERDAPRTAARGNQARAERSAPRSSRHTPTGAAADADAGNAPAFAADLESAAERQPPTKHKPGSAPAVRTAMVGGADEAAVQAALAALAAQNASPPKIMPVVELPSLSAGAIAGGDAAAKGSARDVQLNADMDTKTGFAVKANDSASKSPAARPIELEPLPIDDDSDSAAAGDASRAGLSEDAANGQAPDGDHPDASWPKPMTMREMVDEGRLSAPVRESPFLVPPDFLATHVASTNPSSAALNDGSTIVAPSIEAAILAAVEQSQGSAPFERDPAADLGIDGRIGTTRATLHVGEGDERIALHIATTRDHIRVEATLASQSMAQTMTEHRGELERALEQHGVSLSLRADVSGGGTASQSASRDEQQAARGDRATNEPEPNQPTSTRPRDGVRAVA